MKVFDVMITKEFLQQVTANTEEEAFGIAERNLPVNHEEFDHTIFQIMDAVDIEDID